MSELDKLYDEFPNLIIESCGADIKITNGENEDSPSLEFTLKKELPFDVIFDKFMIKFVRGYFLEQQELKEIGL